MKAFAKRMRVWLAVGALALIGVLMLLFSPALGGGTITASAGTLTNKSPYILRKLDAEGNVVAECEVDEKNFGRDTNLLVYYDHEWAAKHEGTTGTGKWGTEVKVELQEDGKYKVTEMTVNGTGGNMEIPEEGKGFVLSGHGGQEASNGGFWRLETKLGLKVGDYVEFTGTNRFITKNVTKGLEVVVSAKNTEPNGCATVWTSNYTTKVPATAWRNRIACKKIDGDHLYEVTAQYWCDTSGNPATEYTIPAGGIVIDSHGGSYSGSYNATKDCFFNGTQVGDIIYFEDTITLEPAHVTFKSGEFELEVDGINPTEDIEFTGKSVIYTNMASTYKTLARPDETVKEYVIERDGDDGKVTAVKEAGETVIPDYDGFVLSIPSTIDGYDSLEVGDTLTLGGSIDQATAFAIDVTADKKVYIDGANIKRDENQLVLFDDLEFSCPEAQGGVELKPGYTGTNQWGVELKVEWDEESEKYVVTQKTSNGEAANLQIPENGFVLSGNGTAATLLEVFAVGDEVHVYDHSVYTNNKLTSIEVDGGSVNDFDPDKLSYDVTVAEDKTTAPVITYTVQTRMGQAPTVKVNNIEGARGTVTIDVTALDGTKATYTLKLDRAYGIDTKLATITIGDKVMDADEIDEKMTNTKMTVYVRPGELPTVSATANDARATVTVTQATATTKEASILVVADDTTVSRKYTVTFVEADTSLKSVSVGGVALAGFSATKLDYTYTLAKGTDKAPDVAAVATDSKATVAVEQAKTVDGTAKITVTIDEISTTYTVKFEMAKGKSNVGLIVGIVVGAVVVVAAAGVAIFFVMKKKGKNK